MKPFWQSKTLRFNLLAIAALAGQMYGGFVVPVEYQATALAVGNLLLRAVTGQPIDWSQIKLPGGNLPAALVLFALGFGSVFLSGCSAIKVIDERPVLSEFVVRVAVGRVLDEHPAWAQPAQRLSAAAIRVINESDDEVALPELQTFISTQIPWDALTPEEAALLQVLIASVAEEIRSSLARQGEIAPEEIKVRAATVLGWINQVAELHTLRRTASV